MGHYPVVLPDLVFPISTSITNAIDLTDPRFQAIVIYSPAALTGVVTVEVSGDGGVTFQTLRSVGADVALAIDEATPITMIIYDQIQLVSDGVEAAERTFVVRGLERQR